MKTGQSLQEFPIDLLEFVNSVVDEEAEVSRDEKASTDEEIDCLSRVLVRLEKGKTFFLVAEVDGRVIASSDINRQRGHEEHISAVAIIIKRGFRELAIETAMMRILMAQAEGMGIEVLTLAAFASNRRALHVYEKVGFVQTGLIPKVHLKEGIYIGEVIMTRLLE